MIKVEERAVVISHYEILPPDVNVWLKSGWDSLTEKERESRELVCVGTREHCTAVADVVRSVLELNRKGVMQ